jgi:hypothetical protein
MRKLTGKKQIDDKTTIFIIRFGEEKRCLYCNDYGHIKKDCAVYKKSCTKCKGRGHLENECSLAHIVRVETEDIDVGVENEDEDSIIDKNEQIIQKKNADNNEEFITISKIIGDLKKNSQNDNYK